MSVCSIHMFGVFGTTTVSVASKSSTNQTVLYTAYISITSALLVFINAILPLCAPTKLDMVGISVTSLILEWSACFFLSLSRSGARQLSKAIQSTQGICLLFMPGYLGKSCSFGLPRVPFVNCRQFMYVVISLLVVRAGCGI